MAKSFKTKFFGLLLKPKFMRRRKNYLEWEYWRHLGRKPDLENPKTWTEKLLWMNKYWQPEIKSLCADKYVVREYIEGKGLGDLLVPLIGVWDDARDIDFDKLPQRFALKCNHGCKMNIICTDKGKLDKEKAIKKLDGWLKEDFGAYGEKHYHFIKPRIICEEFLPVGNYTELADFKYHCFDGEPKFIGYCYDRDIKTLTPKSLCYSPSWKRLYYLQDDKEGDGIDIPAPQGLDKMYEIAKLLSKGFPYIRVDLYSIKGKIYFGELTLTPDGGIPDREYRKEMVEEFGKYITLPAKAPRE